MSRLQRNIWLACLALAVVLTVRITRHQQYAEQRRAFEARAVSERKQELAELWNGLVYTNAGPRVLAATLLSQIRWSSLQLTDLQENKLKRRLSEVFSYLGNPGFEQYYRLKTENVTSQLVLTRAATKVLSRIGASTNFCGDQESERTLRSLWDNAFAAHKKIPGGITAISLDRIRVATSSTNSHGAILGGKVGNGLTVIVEAMEPGFRYGGQTNAVSSDSAQGLFVHLSFFARSTTSKDSGPVYLSLYWSEPDQEWALSRLFTDGLLKCRFLF